MPVDARSLSKKAGIGAAIGVLFYVANRFENPQAATPPGLSLLLQVLGAALGGIVMYLFVYFIWTTIDRAVNKKM